MSFLEAMQSRYATKLYDADKKVDPAKKEALKEIVRLSPSSINSQPWKFSFISDSKTKQRLAETTPHNKSKIVDCDTIVVFSRINNIAKFEQRIQKELPDSSIEYYNTSIKPKSDELIKAWFDKQIYLAVGVFLSACAEMEIDSTPLEGLDPDKFDAILGYENYATVLAVTIGYRHEDDYNQPSKKPKKRRDFSEVIDTI